MTKSIDLINLCEKKKPAEKLHPDIEKGSMSNDKSPDDMATVVLSKNKGKDTESVVNYIKDAINKSGKKLKVKHKSAIRQAIRIIKKRRSEIGQ